MYSSTVSKLEKMSSNDGVIREEAVRSLDRNIKYNEEEMEMILEQLNICQALLYYQKEAGTTNLYNNCI